MNSYSFSVLENLKKRYYWEQEFLASATEVLTSIAEAIDHEPRYIKNKILERMVTPERIVTFRVPWKDDRGEVQVNTGYRVEFNSAIGPYKGGLRFHSSVNLSIIKCLAFEQTFKNALTGLPMGGGKGGSDFSPVGKSDSEIMTFCQSFMNELFRYIGEDTDVPAGDIGVGTREIGYLFGQYKRLANKFTGVLTGKGLNWGGSYIRPEATGYGLVYFVDEMLKTQKKELSGRTVAVSGFGNVAWGAVQKVNDLGGRVVTLSGPDGFVHDPEGIRGDKVDYMLKMRMSGKDKVQDYADEFKVKFYPNKRPWGIKCDIALPCATQNELGVEDAKELIKNGTMVVSEGSNMSCTQDAIETLLGAKVLYSPGKASNAGGVACSGLEMSQNSLRLKWSKEEVDSKLKNIMKNIHQECVEVAAFYNKPLNYMVGANIAGFKKVADAMIDQGYV